MEDWDQDTLEKAVKQKHAGEKPNQTKIICKFFIEAIENKQYGWCVDRAPSPYRARYSLCSLFIPAKPTQHNSVIGACMSRFWVCPNGGKECQYRHALPPGYVLKSQMKQLMEEEMANKKSVEEEIEEERQKVPSCLRPPCLLCFAPLHSQALSFMLLLPFHFLIIRQSFSLSHAVHFHLLISPLNLIGPLLFTHSSPP